MPSSLHPLVLLIVGCEVAFWVVLLCSLALRYLWQRPTLSGRLLWSLPAIDLLLVLLTALDLQRGATATVAHGLAAVYVGFTVAFGGVAIRWADAQFAYRFAGGPAPPGAPAGWAAVRLELSLWLRCIGAWVIALGLITALIGWLGMSAATQPLERWYRLALGCVFFWFVFGPLWSLVFFKRSAP
jgi:hypothetical protein